MLKIDETTFAISMTRGDNVTLTFSAIDDEGHLYEMQEGDTIKFTVRKKLELDKLIEIVSDNWDIDILPEHTKSLEFGKYYYDVQLNMANGWIETIIGFTDEIKPIFTIWKEVSD